MPVEIYEIVYFCMLIVRIIKCFMSRFFVICLFVCFLSSLFGQSENWMIPPVEHKVRLAGTFGELRNNHFHTGVDIKSSNGKAGDKILAVADGYISRIKISATGYGNALYIDHPNGLTTVYAHLNKFDDTFDEFVEKCQYALEQFEFDTTLSADLFPIIQGQVIGIMGNSGRSYGPHLHFEIRETESEIPYNPLSRGVEITDDVAPNVNYITVNYLDNTLQKRESKKVSVQKSNGIYKPVGGVIKIPAWRVGLSVFTRDLMTGVSNKNGIYSANLRVDDKSVFSFAMDSISFDDFRYLNAHIDYEHYKKSKHRIHQLYRKKGNLIPIYTENEEQVIKLYAEKARKVEIDIADIHGNTSTIKFDILRDTTMIAFKEKSFQYYLEFNEAHIINRQSVKMSFRPNTFYEDYYMSVEQTDEKEANYVSSVFHIGDVNTAIHKSFDLYIKPASLDSNLLSKVFVAHCDKNNYSSYGANIIDNMIGTRVKNLGNYVLMLDTIAPTIVVKSAPKQVQKGSLLRFVIDDNIDSKGSARDLRYNAWVDDQWILMKYDLKTKSISHVVDQKWPKGSHTLKIEIIDDRDNTTIWKKEIIKL